MVDCCCVCNQTTTANAVHISIINFIVNRCVQAPSISTYINKNKSSTIVYIIAKQILYEIFQSLIQVKQYFQFIYKHLLNI